MMKNKILCFVCSGMIFSASYCYAQETLTAETHRLITQIASGINETPETAAKEFSELLKGKNKKNISLLVAIGNAYLDHNRPAEAQVYADRAMKTDSKSAPVYMLAGDAVGMDRSAVASILPYKLLYVRAIFKQA